MSQCSDSIILVTHTHTHTHTVPVQQTTQQTAISEHHSPSLPHPTNVWW